MYKISNLRKSTVDFQSQTHEKAETFPHLCKLFVKKEEMFEENLVKNHPG